MKEPLISSKTRVKLLLKFFLNSNNSSYLRGLESEFGDSTNAIRIELNKLEGAGLLSSELSGNKKFFKANTNHPFFGDIHSLLLKYTGLDGILDRIVESLGDLKYVFVVGKLAKGLSSDIVDLVFVGDIDKAYLFEVVQKAELKLGKKIKYICYASAEFTPAELSQHTDHYLLLWSK